MLDSPFGFLQSRVKKKKEGREVGTGGCLPGEVFFWIVLKRELKEQLWRVRETNKTNIACLTEEVFSGCPIQV